MDKEKIKAIGTCAIFAAVCFIALFFGLSLFFLQAEQELEVIELEAMQKGYVQCQEDTVNSINDTFFQNQFVTLPIQGQDGNHIQTTFITVNRCNEEIQKYLEVP